MRSIALGFFVAMGLVLLAQSAEAQQRMPPFQPSKPALSPYLYLTRPQFGYFPNYQTFVEPYRIQERTNNINQTQINRLNREVQQQQTTLRQQLAPVAPTGTASVYGHTSHYYSSSPTGGSRQGGGRR